VPPLEETKRLHETMPYTGTLEWIGLTPESGAELRVVDEAEVEPGTGLVGDYHAASGKGTRQVTLIQGEHFAVMSSILGKEVTPSDTRRNLVVRGINLVALKKARFSIGDVLFEGTGPCAPCSFMEEKLGPGGFNAMRGHGGICARVLSGGTLRRGDSVAFSPGDGD